MIPNLYASQNYITMNYSNKLLIMFVLIGFASLGCRTHPSAPYPKSFEQSSGNSSNTTGFPVDSKPKYVSATIFPIYSIAQQIGGDNVKVTLLLPSGESPHTFNPTPADKLNAENSELMFYIGGGLDEWIIEVTGTNAKLVEVNEGIRQIQHGSHQEHGDHKYGPNDPHYWLDPRNGKKIANTMAREYALIDLKNASSYQKRLELFNSEMDQLYEELLEHAQIIQDVPFIVLHDSWSYFADAFGLNLVGTFQPYGSHGPSPKYLKMLQDKTGNHDVKVVFSEPQYPIDVLRSFADDNGLKIANIDPLGGVDGRMTFQELLTYNVDMVKLSLLAKK